MTCFVGTSGYSYKEWIGPFYPEGTKPPAMLAYYASELRSVEINNTFYRMPKAEVLSGWAETVPEGFSFVLKVSRRITHHKRLKEAGDDLAYLLETSAALGEKRGPLLFQLPPYLKKDAERLGGFLELIPDSVRAAFEFRNASWFDDEIFALLRARNAALVVADTGDPATDPPFEATANWGYLRLRRESYADGELEAWAEKVKSPDWTDAYVFFKHEDEGAGPRMAKRFERVVELL